MARPFVRAAVGRLERASRSHLSVVGGVALRRRPEEAGGGAHTPCSRSAAHAALAMATMGGRINWWICSEQCFPR
eukprot:491465-Prymnesium_polylepis.1